MSLLHLPMSLRPVALKEPGYLPGSRIMLHSFPLLMIIHAHKNVRSLTIRSTTFLLQYTIIHTDNTDISSGHVLGPLGKRLPPPIER